MIRITLQSRRKNLTKNREIDVIALGTSSVIEDRLITVWFKVKCDVAELKEETFAVEVLLLKSKSVTI